MRKALEVSDRVIDRLLGPAVNQIKAIPSNWAVCVCVCGGGCISALIHGVIKKFKILKKAGFRPSIS